MSEATDTLNNTIDALNSIMENLNAEIKFHRDEITRLSAKLDILSTLGLNVVEAKNEIEPYR